MNAAAHAARLRAEFSPTAARTEWVRTYRTARLIAHIDGFRYDGEQRKALKPMDAAVRALFDASGEWPLRRMAMNAALCGNGADALQIAPPPGENSRRAFLDVFRVFTPVCLPRGDA